MSSFPLPLAPPLAYPRLLLRSSLLSPLSRLCCRVRRVTTRRSPLAALPLASLCPLFPSPPALLSPLSRLCCRVRRVTTRRSPLSALLSGAFCPLSGAISFFVVLPHFPLRQLPSLFVAIVLILSFSAIYPPTHREHPFFFLILIIQPINPIHPINPIFCKHLSLKPHPSSPSVAPKLPICRTSPLFPYQSVASTLPICRTVLLICRRYLTNLSPVNLLSHSPSTTYSHLNKF